MLKVHSMTTVLLAGLCLGICAAQEPEATPEVDVENMDEGLIPASAIVVEDPAPEPPSRADIQQARLAFTQFANRIHIAEATLDEEALERKRKMGRLQALIRATDEQSEIQAAEVQQLEEHFRQVNDQLASLADLQGTRGQTQASARLSQLRTDMEAEIAVAQNELEALTRQKNQALERLEELRTEHLTSLIEASMRSPGNSRTKRQSPAKSLLERELTRDGANSTSKE
ncbi:MAG: hypothetical protein R3C18_04600 [Planctomycetaceae bacterium]